VSDYFEEILKDSDDDILRVEGYSGGSQWAGNVYLRTRDAGFRIAPEKIQSVCRAIYTAAGLAWPPVIPDPLDPVRTSLRELANDPGLCTTERTRAQRALDALS